MNAPFRLALDAAETAVAPRAPLPPPGLLRVRRQIERSFGFARVAALSRDPDAMEPAMLDAVLDAAQAFAADVLEPLNDAMDRVGCRMEGGRVRTAPGHPEAWRAYVEAGWPTLEAEPEHGGQGLPSTVAFAAQALFDRACPAFGMLPVPQRSAARLIAAFGAAGERDAWLPRLASGEWGATICLSEPDAGSDLNRMRARAERGPDGVWRVTGEKSWISFGDHDLTDQIGHCVLARTAQPDGTSRPSLFLVPTLLEDGTRNAVFTRRIEEKMGLHGSPTAQIGFEGAQGVLLGDAGRGLQQMFVMIANMRLAVGAMGLGIADSSLDVAAAYAETRIQGGREPVVIAEHPDVRRQLLDMAGDVEALRGLLFAVANLNEIGGRSPDGAERARSLALAQWLLPIVKTLGGEIAFDASSRAMQVLGGAGYTRDWSVERNLRDARVLTIFEGTTGMQALDLVSRRLLVPDPAGFQAFLDAAGEEAGRCPPLAALLSRLEARAARLREQAEDAPANATAFLALAGRAALGWMAARLAGLDGDGPEDAYLRAAGSHAVERLAAEDGAPFIACATLAERFSAIRRAER